MNAERLLAHYEQVADAPDAIVRLRRFVLDLAVRGKLVPHDPKEEPASELLKRMARKKAQLATAAAKKLQPSAVFRDDELPIALPKNWAWSRLSDIGNLSGGMTPSMNRPEFWDGDIVWLSPKDIKSDEANDSELKITTTGLAETRLQLYRPGSLFMVARSGILKRTFPVSINRVPAAANQDMKVLVPFLDGQERYLQIMFRGLSDFLLRELVKTGTTVQSLKYAEFEQQPFPLPPLAEQHRIVAKVDELMALCKRLETARAEREAKRDRLAAASLARLNAPDPETSQADVRFILDALPALTTRPDQIKQLRQTILNLAVRRKLLPRTAGASNKEVELESLVKIVRGSSPRPKGDPRYYGGTVPRLLIADITRDGKYVVPQLDTLTLEGAKLSRPMPNGSLVLAISGSYGVPAFLAVDACIHDGFIGFRDVSRDVDPQYLYLVMLFRRPYFDDVVKDSGLKNLTTEHLKRLLVPLPPLAEQHRIVAKVDELMRLCDRLEASLTVTAATRRRLLDALLAEALAPADDRELVAAE